MLLAASLRCHTCIDHLTTRELNARLALTGRLTAASVIATQGLVGDRIKTILEGGFERHEAQH